MINDAYRNTTKKFLAALFAAASAFLLGSCGGGGASADPVGGGGALAILPSPGTSYAGIPFTLTITGGRRPYALGSSEPSIFPVPVSTNDNVLTIIPAQPGVVDPGLQPGEVPRRTLTLTARDVNGSIVTTSIAVLQNFLLGYGLQITSTCPSDDPTTAPQACNGAESVVTISPTFNGMLRGNALLRFERVRGTFGFVQCGSPPPVDPTVVQNITTNTDHTGIAHVCIRTANNSPTQVATFRVIDVATGVYVDELFVITGGPASGALTVLPSTLSFAGANSTRCGTGSGDVLVFDGALPYMAVSSNPAVSVTPSTSNTEPGRFTIQIGNLAPPCITDAQVVITDSQGRRATVTVTQTAGPAPTPITVTPSALTLTCGQSNGVVLTGGTGGYSGAAPGPHLSVAVLGSNATITATTGNGVADPTLTQRSVVFTDGASTATVTVTSPTVCP